MPELKTPDGATVETSPQLPLAKSPDEVNREFSRAMASEDPSATQPPPQRPVKEPGEQKKRPGRPRKEDKARADDKSPAVSQKVDDDFTEACTGITTLGWFALAATPFTSPYAAVVDANQEQLVAALNGAAQNNARARDAIQRMTNGGGGLWAVQLSVVTANMSMQALQLLRDPELRREAAEHTQAKFKKFLHAQGVELPGEEPADGPAE